MGVGAVPFDQFRFLLIHCCQLGPGIAVDAQQFVELGVDRLCVAMLGALDQQRHEKRRDGGGAGPAETSGIEYQPSRGESADDKEGYRMRGHRAEASEQQPDGIESGAGA